MSLSLVFLIIVTFFYFSLISENQPRDDTKSCNTSKCLNNLDHDKSFLKSFSDKKQHSDMDGIQKILF